MAASLERQGLRSSQLNTETEQEGYSFQLRVNGNRGVQEKVQSILSKLLLVSDFFSNLLYLTSVCFFLTCMAVHHVCARYP